jgi:hypothetical protein
VADFCENGDESSVSIKKAEQLSAFQTISCIMELVS